MAAPAILGPHATTTQEVIAAAIEVHKAIGPGCLEKAYAAFFGDAMARRGLQFEAEVAVPVEYAGRRVDAAFRADFVVDRQVVVEIKAVDILHASHEAQVLTYVRLGGFPVGLLFNFNAPRIMPAGFRRFVGARRESPLELSAGGHGRVR